LTTINGEFVMKHPLLAGFIAFAVVAACTAEALTAHGVVGSGALAPFLELLP
jgi:hypothetical protein